MVATTLVKNADRMMCSATLLDNGIELTFADGCAGLIPFSQLPDVVDGGGARQLELPNPLRDDSHYGGWRAGRNSLGTFARHYCDRAYRPRVEAIARQGRASLGQRIRELRDTAGLTQEGLAARASVGRVTLARIEKRPAEPPVQDADRHRRRRSDCQWMSC